MLRLSETRNMTEREKELNNRERDGEKEKSKFGTRLLRSIFGGRSRDPTRRTPAWRSTSAGRWKAMPK